LISYEKEVDVDNKLNNYLKMTDIISNMFRVQTISKETRIKLYNTLALPAVLYGSDYWTIKARDAGRKSAADMKHMRITAGQTRTDYKPNTEIAKELHITPVLGKNRNTEETGCNI
jgi:hypothetical protein